MTPKPGPGSPRTNRPSGRAKSLLVCLAVLVPGALASWTNQATAADASAAEASAAATGEFKTGDWPFLPLGRPAVPEVKRLRNWVRNPIDAFVGQKLEDKRLSPSAVADKLTLLRRVTYDLTGLPPTPKEQADFLADRSPEAYAKVVDRLLASPRYGERRAAALVGPGALQRDRGVQKGQSAAGCVQIPRLCDSRIQRRSAL